MTPTALRCDGAMCRLDLLGRLIGGSRAVALVCLALFSAIAAASCSSSSATPPTRSSTSSTSDPTSTVRAAVLSAWRAAENAFYQAEADPNGLSLPALTSTMVDPELQMVKANLAGNQSEGFLGHGTWRLGSPRVLSLGPTENQPTTATVVSCIDDTQILVNEHTGQAASGTGGTPDWIGATSTLVLTSSGWMLSQQAAVLNSSRSVACAGI